jgi:hypothetical protein
MIKKLNIIFSICILFSSCMNVAPIRQKQLIRPYPTSHIFNLPVNCLKDSIVTYFANARPLGSKMYNELIFYYYSDISGDGEKTKTTVSFCPETFNDKHFSKGFFSTSGTENDIYLHSFGQFWNSPVYFANGDPLEFRAQFKLILKPINSKQTLLRVDADNPRVIKGISGIGPHGFICREISVKPTTVEEYCLLLYIADQLGDRSLLPLDLKKNIR